LVRLRDNQKMTDDQDDEKRALLHCLDYQRDSVLSILHGLS
jgi:hypothetical protein